MAPTATFGNGGAVNEGSTGTVGFSGQTDPSHGRHDGRLHLQLRLRQRRHLRGHRLAECDSATVPASYLADGPGSRTVRGRIIDKDGGFTDYTTTITILNVDPTDQRRDGRAVTGQRGQPDHGHGHRDRPGRRQRPAQLRLRLRR